MSDLRLEPACGERLVRHVGDTVRFVLSGMLGEGRAFLRTDIGRAAALREGVVRSIQEPEVQLESSWRDIPMIQTAVGWELSLVLAEVGWFQSKAYLLSEEGRQIWPEGDNVGISVHPDFCRTANTVYCAFPRMFGPNKSMRETSTQAEDQRIQSLDEEGYTVIPPSGTFRSLKAELPHIFETLGCRILHLLPVNPAPTTFARMGRFGSPYACGDLTAVDSALVEFDKRTTGTEQFCELADAVHGLGGRVFVDLVINHTGWGSTLQNEHPEWFLREENGDFASPGAWGVTWGDLVELEPHHSGLWEHLAEAFLTWCRRGVDGFRCDAGYKVPMPVWRYIIARVRVEFPNAVFLLEGLGGAWEDTENLLTRGGMQWAYSELFQEYEGERVAAYLDHALKQSQRVGTLIHYSETHDNERLAAKGRAWSLLRNRLCALASVNGGFGFTNGVEWLAEERINVHSARGLNWSASENIVGELARLNELLAVHPCFFDGAKLERLSGDESSVFALRRTSADGKRELFILANTDMDEPREFVMSGEGLVNLIGAQPGMKAGRVVLEPAQVVCFGLETEVFSDPDYAIQRARVAWAIQCLANVLEPEEMGIFDWQELAALCASDPHGFLSALPHVEAGSDLLGSLRGALAKDCFPQVSTWRPRDASRVMLHPPDHWLLIRDEEPFRVSFGERQAESVPVNDGHVAAFAPVDAEGDVSLRLRRLRAESVAVEGVVRLLPHSPGNRPFEANEVRGEMSTWEQPTVLLSNGRGGMARLAVDLGFVKSKYDCLLGANLHPDSPVDRHVFAKRVRVWAVADGLITPLNAANLLSFSPGPPARWRFLVSAGDSRAVEIELVASMLEMENKTVLVVRRIDAAPTKGMPLEADKDFSLTMRVDIEDRSFHAGTNLDPSYEDFFREKIFTDENGFRFVPDLGRRLRVHVDRGTYHPEMEWSRGIPHSWEADRGQEGCGDACSPGWFEIPLKPGDEAEIQVNANGDDGELIAPAPGKLNEGCDPFGRRLRAAMRQFVVQRGKGYTVIAGYPWFLDWGRDTFIAARGMLAADWHEEVRGIVHTFARLEREGTLPNALHGGDDSNRETSDAPLWFGLVCEELASRQGEEIFEEDVGNGRCLREVLISIGSGYRAGTPNGIHMDETSGLIWSPSHFTWMDTNHPAGTPREGYPVEIQALWIRLLRQLAKLESDAEWGELAERASTSLGKLFVSEEKPWLADLIRAEQGQTAMDGLADFALRCNGLIAVALEIVGGAVARGMVEAALNHLLVPGGLRTLAPLRVDLPLEIRGSEGQLLNDPWSPYFGIYSGDEDTSRKPAYHNGTAWGWPLPVFCEALVHAWGQSPESVAAAKGYLLSVERPMDEGCLGQLPEIMDGDAPHVQRGCDAQAWSVSEALRVWTWLNEK
ncbi:MAG: amylo-alpha-1,6-glucosidase [Verrucomicrobiales bacterium]|nr:amylo-alpha-1,6-glucosidase [Verrucomicrobiales bacterium]